jgi:DNA invertase Pin-like site-specific DNA recombinase
VASTPIRCAVYLRVSTRDQRLAQQFRELRAAVEARGWRIVAVYRERRSAAPGTDRPRWRALQQDAARRRFGAVAASSLDRLGRSALDILTAVEAFRARGVRLYLAREGLSTEDATGQLLLTVLAGVAQLERDVISERTRAGLRAARLRGAAIGRPRERITEGDLQRVRSGSLSRAALARELGVSVRTVRRRMRTETPLQH